MPKKGDRLRYRVAFQYPSQDKPSRDAYANPTEALIKGGEIGRNGATVTVWRINDDDTTAKMAEFGPDVFHWFDRINLFADLGAYCRCGLVVTGSLSEVKMRDEVTAHMRHAGLCGACWGGTTVAQNSGGQLGNLIDCPVCQGSGEDADVSWYGLDASTFHTRLDMLRLTPAKTP